MSETPGGRTGAWPRPTVIIDREHTTSGLELGVDATVASDAIRARINEARSEIARQTQETP